MGACAGAAAVSDVPAKSGIGVRTPAAGVPANVGGFLSAGTSVGERLVHMGGFGDTFDTREIHQT